MRFGTMVVCVLLPAGLAAQTTYSSPVKITNTPVPVNGDVKVTGNVPVVNPSGVPMQVKAWDTIPVAVTGTAAVTVSGTPTVGLAPGANAVKMATPTVFSRFSYLSIPRSMELSSEEVIGMPLPAGELIEIESVIGSCWVQVGAKMRITLKATPYGTASKLAHAIPVQHQALGGPQSYEFFYFNEVVKIYAQPGTELVLMALRDQSSALPGECHLAVYGKVY